MANGGRSGSAFCMAPVPRLLQLLMLLLFVGGAMNLVWAAGLAVLVMAEKLLPRGDQLARGSGLLFGAAGLGSFCRRCWGDPALGSDAGELPERCGIEGPVTT